MLYSICIYVCMCVYLLTISVAPQVEIHIRMCVCTCMWSCICVCEHLCRPEVSCPHWFSACLFFWDRVSHWNWNSLVGLGWLDNMLQHPPCLCLPSSGIASARHHSWMLIWGLGIELGSSSLLSRHFTNWAISPDPWIPIFTKPSSTHSLCDAHASETADGLISQKWSQVSEAELGVLCVGAAAWRCHHSGWTSFPSVNPSWKRPYRTPKCLSLSWFQI